MGKLIVTSQDQTNFPVTNVVSGVAGAYSLSGLNYTNTYKASGTLVLNGTKALKGRAWKQGEKFDCPECFGTTFEGGIKRFHRMWSSFGDHPNEEKHGKRGVYEPEDREVQLEAAPMLTENDYLVRVVRWSQDHRPLAFGSIFVLDAVQVESLRTGNQYANTQDDNFGQTVRTHAVGKEHPIHRALGTVLSDDFPVTRLDGKRR